MTYLLDEANLPWKLQRSHIPARVVRWYHLTVPGEKIVDCLLGAASIPAQDVHGRRSRRTRFSSMRYSMTCFANADSSSRRYRRQEMKTDQKRAASQQAITQKSPCSEQHLVFTQYGDRGRGRRLHRPIVAYRPKKEIAVRRRASTGSL